METLNSSAQRLAATLRHERPDRIPIDLGSTAVTGIHVSCVITMTFLSLVKAFTAAGAFWIYAVLCAATVWFVWRFVPETKGLNLEEIERQWKH